MRNGYEQQMLLFKSLNSKIEEKSNIMKYRRDQASSHRFGQKEGEA
jgi:hypothetical protein